MSLKKAQHDFMHIYMDGWKENEEQIWRFANEAKYNRKRERGGKEAYDEWVNEWMTRANIKEIIRVELLPFVTWLKGKKREWVRKFLCLKNKSVYGMK